MSCTIRIFVVLLIVKSILGFGCEYEGEITYPTPQNHVDVEIDELLTQSEYLLFSGDFKFALEKIERAETLFALTSLDDRRLLRSYLDKAILVTCVDGPTEHSRKCFGQFEELLHSKSCTSKSQIGAGGKKNWQIFGPDVMAPVECAESVENMVNFALLAASSLPVNRQALFAIETTIYTMGRQAKRCCTENGFWKTCMQPLVDAAKNMQLGIPPDPYWD